MSTIAPPAPVVEPPHPKIRARRIEVRRDEGRRRRQRLIVLLVVVALVSIAAGLTRSPALDVDHIEVVGAQHTSAAAVASAAGLRHRQPMTDVDVGAAVDHIETLPWVRSASVRRQWPGTVAVQVTERQAVAQVRTGDGRWASIDETGRVLEATKLGVAGLVQIDKVTAGAPGSSVGASAGPGLRLAAALTPKLRPLVAAITIRAGGELSMRLAEDGIAVNIGPATGLPAKVQALAALLASAVRTPPIKTIDVSVPSASVLTRQPGRA